MNNKNPLKKNSYFDHLLRYQKIYLCMLLVILFAVPLASNYRQEKPLLMGGESYYYLSSAQQELPYHPLTLLFRIIPDSLAYLVPPLLSLGIILLVYPLARKIDISEEKLFFIVLFYILTPTYIFTSVTLSSYSLFLLLVLLGVNLLLLETTKRYLALLPFLLASWNDTFSGLLLLGSLAGYFFLVKKSKERFQHLLLISIAAMMALNTLLLKAPFFLGSFTVQDKAADLISDLGSFSGVGVFAILLAVVGFIASWQKKNILLLLPPLTVLTAAYFFNTHTTFFFSLFIVILAAVGFATLLEQNWKLSFLRNAVLLLLLLGISFSAVAYLGRLSEYQPTAIDQDALEWIRQNTDQEAVVLSAPENSYYISHFAKRKPVFALHLDYRDNYQLSQDIFTAFYIDQLFPLLEKNKVSIIYVSEEMKQSLPQEQEFLFLLQNERFKLLYSAENAEVWSFEEEKK
ncbi:MAG: hypothetical protein Q7S55_03525 [Nanoarchaeota archaeon]|nr:hypothetical protein [Nanoarchaeota archaeon]